jgi:putative ABC transport system permease protein
MKLINKITLQSLMKNRTRTIVTIIGVILSASMITAVTTFVSSLQDYMRRDVIANHGEWELKRTWAGLSDYEEIKESRFVKRAMLVEEVGNHFFNIDNPGSGMVCIYGLSSEAIEHLPFRVISGRLPQNDTEITLSNRFRNEKHEKLTVGDTLTIDIHQGRGYTIGDTVTKTYTIVGVVEPIPYIPTNSYLTFMSEPDDSKMYNVYVKLHNTRDVFKYDTSYTKGRGGGYSSIYLYNDSYLRVMGISHNDNTNAVIYGLAGVVIALIMMASVLLIFNAFSISISERTKQFGILKSVGATGKQVAKSVFMEGFYIGIIGIPLGILAGIGGIGVALDIVMGILEDLMSGADSTQMYLVVSWQAVAVAALIAIFTIAFSAYTPAMRASRISAIDSIRQSHDVKIKGNQIKTSKLTQKLLGIEGTLSRKNFKRNKKRYKSTIVSLFVSVVLFIGASSLGLYLNISAERVFMRYPYDISVRTTSYSKMVTVTNGITGESREEFMENIIDESMFIGDFNHFMDIENVTDGSFKFSISTRTDTFPAEILTDRWLATFGDYDRYDYDEYIWVHFIDEVTHSQWLSDLRLPPDYLSDKPGAFLASTRASYTCPETERFLSLDLFKDKSPLTISLWDNTTNESRVDPENRGEEIQITMHHAAFPPWIWDTRDKEGNHIFVPYSQKDRFLPIIPEIGVLSAEMVFTTRSPIVQMEKILEYIVENNRHKENEYTSVNYALQEEENRRIMLVINIFVFGFITLMSLITIANVFNTITTSINLRRREFAMLKAVGMTSGSLNKMMVFECMFYGLKALLFALPVSVGVTWLIYNSVLQGIDVPFTLPWGSVGLAVAGVFAIVFVTMMYAISKIKKENTVEALKNEML